MISNKIGEFVYGELLKPIRFSKYNVPSRILRRAYAAIRIVIINCFDPLVNVKIRKQYMTMNLSHQLPMYIASHPYYDTALPRICTFVKEKLGNLTLIDVGANIGDTVSLVSQDVSGKFLCIEADKNYFSLLAKNTKNIENTVCLNIICSDGVVSRSDGKRESALSIIRSKGTAHIIQGNECNEKLMLHDSCIDEIIEDDTDFMECNVIKIDTDGYDYKVLRGSDKLLNRTQPVIYFELMPATLLENKEDPMSIFDYLERKGYRNVLFYDHVGIPVIKINIAEREYISQLINYISNKNLIFDVLSFHDSMKEDFDLFYEKEMGIFSKA